MSRMLTYVKTLPACDGSSRGAVHTDGKLEGITKDGQARSGTEAAILKDFAEKGELPDALHETHDKYVRKDGTNRDTAEVIGREISAGLLKGVGALFDVVSFLAANTLGKIPGVGKLLSASIEISADTVANFSHAGAEIVGKDLQKDEKARALETAKRHTAADTVGAVVGMADPSGVASNLARGAVDHAIEVGAEKKAASKASQPKQ
jgi:hypothetical protein